MRWIVKLKFVVLVAVWSALCLGIWALLALMEAVGEIALGVAGAAVGQGRAGAGIADFGGDLLQWGLLLGWLLGIGALWFVKRLFTSREARKQAASVMVKAAGTAVPHIIDKHPVGKAVNLARGPGGKFLGGILARKLGGR